MMRKCHLNTCPVGVATQNPELRHRFVGKPEDVTNFFLFVAEEVRELMAKLGYRNFNDMIGQTDRLKQRRIDDPKVRDIDLAKVLYKPENISGGTLYQTETQDHGLEEALDQALIARSQAAIEHLRPVRIDLPISNVNRTVGALLSGDIARRYGDDGLPDGSIHVKFNGTAGQSFGAFLARGVTFELEGQGNDYVGKGISGGKIVIYPKAESTLKRDESVIVGNTVLYGGISGECYLSGVAGERFAVRNSGVVAVVEGVGSHGCEYMTGGVVVVLGSTGSNFAAGMSGGVAYVLDEAGTFADHCNMAMVDLEPVEAEDEALSALEDRGGDLEAHGHVDIMQNMNEGDAKRLRTLIERHVAFTGSPRGRTILENWSAYRTKFVKVMPTEYRRALQQLQTRPLVSVGA
jgi:glutamate synthase (NADPH/NADH) large chain